MLKKNCSSFTIWLACHVKFFEEKKINSKTFNLWFLNYTSLDHLEKNLTYVLRFFYKGNKKGWKMSKWRHGLRAVVVFFEKKKLFKNMGNIRLMEKKVDEIFKG